MMSRLRIAGRIGIMLAVLMLAIWMIVIGWLYLYSETEADGAIPPPERLAAIAAIMDETGAGSRAHLAEAISSSNLRIRVGPAFSAAIVPPETDARIHADYAPSLGGHAFTVAVEPRGELEARFPWLFGTAVNALRFEIRLEDGGLLTVTTRSSVAQSRLGLPIGFGAGLVGTLVAALALVLMHRETFPLRRLAAIADRMDFSGDQGHMPVPRGSAPEIRSLVEAFNRLQTRLSQLLRGRMAMLGGMSHDVRTFATRLRLRLDQMPEGPEKERAVQDIADIIRLLDDALLASRAGVGELADELVEFDDLVAAEIDDRRKSGAPVDLIVAAGTTRPMVLGDRVALRRIVANLVDNALTYGRVAHAALEGGAREVTLTVDDEGGGIPEAHRALVMEPFVRLETSRSRETGGAGLGLAVVRSLVEAHGGSLSLEDAPSRGARIRVRLPLFEAGRDS